MIIGYARVSTNDQNLDVQIADLKIYGCEKIHKEKQSAVKERPELDKLLSNLRKGDTVVVWKLDRLGRSLKHLIDLMNSFKEKEVEFISLNDPIDTTTIQGRLVFNLFASFAEFERELIRERTIAGLRRARENGRVGGKRPGLSDASKHKARYILHRNKINNQLPKSERKSVDDLVSESGVSRATFYRYLSWAEKEELEKTTKKKEKGIKLLIEDSE